jgi:hypothetical protein
LGLRAAGCVKSSATMKSTSRRHLTDLQVQAVEY